MAGKGGTLDYVLLWDVSLHTPIGIKHKAMRMAEHWPGIPSNPISPNPISMNLQNYTPRIIPIPPLGGRRTRRGRGYAGLSNYNNIP